MQLFALIRVKKTDNDACGSSMLFPQKQGNEPCHSDILTMGQVHRPVLDGQSLFVLRITV